LYTRSLLGTNKQIFYWRQNDHLFASETEGRQIHKEYYLRYVYCTPHPINSYAASDNRLDVIFCKRWTNSPSYINVKVQPGAMDIVDQEGKEEDG
jgi:hypothetical protein